MNQEFPQQDLWVQSINGFKLHISCPHCSTSITVAPTTQQLSRCEHCKGLFEWTKHEGEINIFWPRCIEDAFSSLDGHRYQHTSLFDFSELTKP